MLSKTTSVKNKVQDKARNRVSRQVWSRVSIHLSSKVTIRANFRVDSQVGKEVCVKTMNQVYYEIS